MQILINLFWNTQDKRLRAFWRIVLQLFGTFSITGLCSFPFIFIYIINGTRVNKVEDAPFLTLVSSAAMAAATLITVWACARWVDKRPFSSYGFHLSPLWIADLVFGSVLGAFLMTIIFFGEYALGWVEIRGTLITANNQTPFWAGMIETILLFIIVGLYEEILIRGYLLRNLAEGLKMGRLRPHTALLFAWVLSSTFFGVLHASNPNATLISTLNLIMAGLFLGLGFILTGDLAISIGLHITWNFFQGNIYGFPVSGTTPIVSVVGITQKGMDIITGGPFGPEAGCIGLVAILFGSLLIIAWIYLTRKHIQLNESLTIYIPRQTVLPYKK